MLSKGSIKSITFGAFLAGASFLAVYFLLPIPQSIVASPSCATSLQLNSIKNSINSDIRSINKTLKTIVSKTSYVERRVRSKATTGDWN